MVAFLSTVNEIVHFFIGLCTTDDTGFDRYSDRGAHRNASVDSIRCRLPLSDFSVGFVSLMGQQLGVGLACLFHGFGGSEHNVLSIILYTSEVPKLQNNNQ
jgi:hypothetical protein